MPLKKTKKLTHCQIINRKTNYRQLNTCDNCYNNYPRQIRYCNYELITERICIINKCKIRIDHICDMWKENK